MNKSPNIKDIATLLRVLSLKTTTQAGSGHPTSSMSPADLMATLMFGGFFRYDIDDPSNPNNDRLIFSKGHASPLFYALWAIAGGIPTKELYTLREFGSRLEGHPTKFFPYTEVSTGSLGQGLSVGVGMALNAQKLDALDYRTYVLLGDSEMAEGSNYEAMELAAYYNLHSLTAIVDVNRLGQRGETMLGHDTQSYVDKAKAFGWNARAIDGHNLEEIDDALREAQNSQKPSMIVAKTLKGSGVSFLEDENGWHGKPLNQKELDDALNELGSVDDSMTISIPKPKKVQLNTMHAKKSDHIVTHDGPISTRKAYGMALNLIADEFPELVVLDAETSNSTYANMFGESHPERFFEMFIAEQNMVGVAQGLSTRGKKPFVSTFSAFLTRAFDQIRVGRYGEVNVTYVGSHAGISIGPDGATQMGLEDIAMFRSVFESVVIYPSDMYSTIKLTQVLAQHKGTSYLRTTRGDTPLIYSSSEEFEIGGSKTIKSSESDSITIVAAGITLHESLKAYEELKKKGIHARIIDLYSIKPLDEKTLQKAAKETKNIVTVEDHYVDGGLGDAVAHALADSNAHVHILGVSVMPRSGETDELLDYAHISAEWIVKKVLEILK